jgi:hypothetical protein
VALLTETEFNRFRDTGPNLIGTSVRAIDFPGSDPNINGNWWLLTPGVGYSEAVPGSVVRFVADSDTLELRLDGTVIAFVEPRPTEIGDEDGDGIKDLMVKFDRQTVNESLTPGPVTLAVFGYLNDGIRSFTGIDTIMVIAPDEKKGQTGGPSGGSPKGPGDPVEKSSGSSSPSLGAGVKPPGKPASLPAGSGSETEATPEGFVTRFYQQILGREPDSPGLAGWGNSLKDALNTGEEEASPPG